MAGCMVFVFAALAEFVVVKVLDVQYQQQSEQAKLKKPILPLRLQSTMEKGQVQTCAVFDGTNVRSRKTNTQTTTPTPAQVSSISNKQKLQEKIMINLNKCRLTYSMEMEGQGRYLEGNRYFQYHGQTMKPVWKELCGARSTKFRVSSFLHFFSYF